MTLDDYLNRDVDKPAIPPLASGDRIAPHPIPKSGYPDGIPTDNTPDYGKMIKEKGYFGVFQSLNKKPDFNAEEKRLKRSRQLSVIGDLATLGGQAIASMMGARKFAPIQSDAPKYNDQLERLRNARMAYDAEYNDKSLSMIFRDYERKRAEEQYRSQMQAKAQKEAYDRVWDRYKFDKEQEHRENTLKANAEAKSSTLTETRRHNKAMEGISRTNAETARAKVNAKKSREIAYATKYGNVVFDNPKNKRAATLSVLEIMRNGAPDSERKKIDDMMYLATSGDVNSYNKAEMYVAQHLNTDAVALKHLYELAKSYGRVESVASQKRLRDDVINRNRADDDYSQYEVGEEDYSQYEVK
ncbi:hypothetical protein [Bacteroides heparinolyticus]|uniref:hypothetical protein n=1 Tax=Prevotella heparinolytica TaxID=28113 RepID=UPI0023F99712|nr:hypothetical protein [Bacteroides heparinolyticus]MCI6213262.1 hypothetical protein [Bacteroides heparinolyticus]